MELVVAPGGPHARGRGLHRLVVREHGGRRALPVGHARRYHVAVRLHVSALLVHQDVVGRSRSRAVPHAGALVERDDVAALLQDRPVGAGVALAFLIGEVPRLLDPRQLAALVEFRLQVLAARQDRIAGLLRLLARLGRGHRLRVCARGRVLGAEPLDDVVVAVSHEEAAGIERAVALAGAGRQELQMRLRGALNRVQRFAVRPHLQGGAIGAQHLRLRRLHPRPRQWNRFENRVPAGHRLLERAPRGVGVEIQIDAEAGDVGPRGGGHRKQPRIGLARDLLHLALGRELHVQPACRILQLAAGLTVGPVGQRGFHRIDGAHVVEGDHSLARFHHGRAPREPRPRAEQHVGVFLQISRLPGFDLHGLALGILAAPVQFHLAHHLQLAQSGVVRRADRFALAFVELEVRGQCRLRFAGLGLVRHSSAVDLDLVAVRRPFDREAQFDLHGGVGVQRALIVVELCLGRADAVQVLAIVLVDQNLDVFDFHQRRSFQLTEALGADLHHPVRGLVLTPHPGGGLELLVEGKPRRRPRLVPGLPALLAKIGEPYRAQHQHQYQQQQSARAPQCKLQLLRIAGSRKPAATHSNPSTEPRA